MRNFYIISLLYILFLTLTNAQNIINVSPGDGTLKQAIAGAQSGDILRLVPGGSYSESQDFLIPITKKITIEVDGDEQSAKPVITLLKPADAGSQIPPQFFSLKTGASLTVKGLEFDGRRDGVTSVNYFIRFDLGSVPGPTNIGTIKVINCEVHHTTKDFIDGQQSNQASNLVVDSVIIINSIIHDVGPVVHFKYASVKYIEIRNTTFYKFGIYGVRVLGKTNTLTDITPNVVIDRVTFDNVLSGPKNFIYGEEQKGYWSLTNSIFSNLNDNPPGSQKGLYWKNKEYSLYDSVAEVRNCCLWNDGKRDFRLNSFKDTITMNPNYADAANGDFTLPKGSVLLTFSNKKGPIGDPRWGKNSPTGIEKISKLPSGFSLEQNFPNPFNPVTKIKFSLNKSGITTLEIFDMLGRRIKTLVNENLSIGIYEVDFNAKDLPSGIYFYKLNILDGSITNKMMLIK